MFRFCDIQYILKLLPERLFTLLHNLNISIMLKKSM